MKNEKCIKCGESTFIKTRTLTCENCDNEFDDLDADDIIKELQLIIDKNSSKIDNDSLTEFKEYLNNLI